MASPQRPDTGPARGAAIGAVLCGGRSSRFGSDKAVADAGGRPMGALVVGALRAGGCDPVVAVGGTAGPTLAIPTITDNKPGEGPLAALATVLVWAGSGLVVVVPCDLPLLGPAAVEALVAAAEPDRAAVAIVDGVVQPSLACWPAAWGRPLTGLVESGNRAWRHALDAGPWTTVDVPASSISDADTPGELASLLKIAASDEEG